MKQLRHFLLLMAGFLCLAFSVNAQDVTNVESGKFLGANDWGTLASLLNTSEPVFAEEATLENWTREFTGEDQDGSFVQNTWSVENDASGITTPFIETWVWGGNGAQLSNEKIYRTIENLKPGNYQVKLLLRAYNEMDGSSTPSGVKISANDASVDISEGQEFSYNNMAGIYDNFTIVTTVGQDGKLDIAVEVYDSRVSWIAFKNLEVFYADPIYEDVTAYIDNSGFDEDLTFGSDGSIKDIVDDSTYQYNRSISWIATDSTIYAHPTGYFTRPDGLTDKAMNGFIGRIKGWTIETNQTFPNCEWVYFGTVPYDLEDQAIPIADDGSTFLSVPEKPSGNNGENNIGALYLRAGWGSSCIYKQTVSLPYARYRLDYWVYNANYERSANNSGVRNLCKVTCRADEFLDEDGFNASEWTKHSIEFVPTSDFTIQFGFESSGASGSNPFLFIDNIKLYKIGEAAESPEDLLHEDIAKVVNELSTMAQSMPYSQFPQIGNDIENVLTMTQEATTAAETPDELTAILNEAVAFRNRMNDAYNLLYSVYALYDKASQLKEQTSYPGYDDFVKTFDDIVNRLAQAPLSEMEELQEELLYTIQNLEVLVIETTQAGELGNLVLDYVENFSDVKKLKVIGPINSTDMERIAAMTSATEINLGEAWGLTTLSNNIFQNNTTLERIILPNSLTQMNSYAFENCRALKYVYLPGSLQTGYAAFYNCSQLETVELGEGITTIRENMFSNCYRLKTVQFPSTLKIIESSAFYNCYSLTNFTLPYGLTTIGYRAFYRSSIDASAYVGYYYDNNGNYQEVYVANVSPTTLTCPQSLTSIDYQAFVNWRDLTSIRLNEGLVSIGDEAFAGNNVTSITLPSTLTQIGSDIFTNKDITVTSYAVIPPTETRSNNAVLHPDTLYVPNIAVKAYKQAKGWTNFNIVGFNYIPNDIVVAGELTLEVKNGAFAEVKPNMWLNSDPQNTNYSDAKYGALTVKGDETISMGRFNLIADANCYGRTYYWDYRNYRSYTTLLNNASMRADNVNTFLCISSGQWFFFSFPYDVKVSDIIDAFGNAQWVIRKYDGEKRAAAATGETWVNVGEDDILEAYQGYIWQMGQRGSENWGGFDIPAINNSNKNNIFANADVEVTLAEYQSEFAHNRSWNLIGNPYPCYYDTRAMKFTAPITVWNRSGQNYEAYSPIDDSYILAPYEAFFVQRPVDQESIIFTKEGRQHSQTVDANASYGAKMRDAAAYSARSVFNLTLSNGEMSDRTRVVFNEDAIMDYELDKDASKFMANTEIPQLFSLDKDVRYAINERPFDKGSVCLGYKVAANGTYTIAVNTKAKGTVMLEDTETGEVMNLSENAYSFSATAGTNESRFILHFSGEDATSIHSIDIAGKTNISELYTLDGRRLNGTVTTGVYLMKKGQTFQKVFVK